MEHSDESNILLRRRMCWDMADMLYISINLRSQCFRRSQKKAFLLIEIGHFCSQHLCTQQKEAFDSNLTRDSVSCANPIPTFKKACFLQCCTMVFAKSKQKKRKTSTEPFNPRLEYLLRFSDVFKNVCLFLQCWNFFFFFVTCKLKSLNKGISHQGLFVLPWKSLFRFIK